MRENVPFLAHQIARFGALTIQQMRYMCNDRFSRSAIYRTLAQLMRDQYLGRISHSSKPLVGYAARPEIYQLVYGESHQRHTGPRGKELEHTLLCTEVMIQLSRYSAVTGIATEHEWTPEEIKLFCHERIPDGIIQLTRDSLSYEIAVEVELSLKSERATNLVLSNYRQTFLRNMPCVGVLIIAADFSIVRKYQSLMANLPTEVEERILLTTVEGLDSLNPKYYGTRGLVPGSALETLRQESQGRGSYVCMKSTGYRAPVAFMDANRQRGSEIINEV